MVVAGLPTKRPDHASALASFAIEMTKAATAFRDPEGRGVPFRIGIASGPVVAGVVGARKFFYDVWGDTVNLAARMETTGVPGRIQVTQKTYEQLRTMFVLENRGQIEIKGKGLMQTWFLEEPMRSM
jgi:adenylate cyclase